MNDKALFTLLRSLLLAEFAEQDVPLPGGVLRANQVERQGTQTAACLYFYKINATRYGFPEVRDVYDAEVGDVVETATQNYRTTLQFEAWVPQANEATERTPADYVELAADLLSLPASIETLQAAGVGLEKIADIRNPYFQDDRNQNSASPSFDVTFTHKRVVVKRRPAVQTIEPGVYRV